MERPEPGYESMAHFVTNTEDVADMLRTIDFNTSRASGSCTIQPYMESLAINVSLYLTLASGK